MDKPDLRQFGLTKGEYRLVEVNRQQRLSNLKFMWGYGAVLSGGAVLLGSELPVVLICFSLGVFWGFVSDLPRRFRHSARKAAAAQRFDEATSAYTEWLREQDRLRAQAAHEAALAERRKRESFWRGLTGREFELETAALLRRIGHQVRVVGGRGDQGIDLMIDDDSVAQCKAHDRPLSPATVREFYGATTATGARKAILITLNGCTSEAQLFADGVGIEVWDVEKLISLDRQRT